MMAAQRSVPLSTDVYAAIWAERKPGEETEDDILRRKFGLKVDTTPPNEKRVGWVDPRQGVTLHEGQEVYRVYKGKEYRAKATDGCFQLLPNGAKVNSLNQLSRIIGAGTENAWQNWYVDGPDGKRMLIQRLRKK